MYKKTDKTNYIIYITNIVMRPSPFPPFPPSPLPLPPLDTHNTSTRTLHSTSVIIASNMTTVEEYYVITQLIPSWITLTVSIRERDKKTYTLILKTGKHEIIK